MLSRIIFITPTYERATQKAELIRLSQTLLHVANIFWIVVTDGDQISETVIYLLYMFFIFVNILSAISYVVVVMLFIKML